MVDGKTTAVPGAHCLGFSPDGAHYAYLAGHDGQLVLDGVAQPVVNSNAVPGYLFSPDSKHWVMTGYSEAKGGRRGLFVDGKLVLNDEHGGTAASRPIFTPDSQHLLWISPRRTETTDDRDSSELFVDGQDTHIRFVGFYASVRGDWEMSADGTLSFIVRTGDAVKRYRVTPPADTSVATMLAHAS